MPAFRTPVDIANRALQLLRRPAIFSFSDGTLEAVETARCYDGLRLAELRRAVWRFSTRRVVLRPITTTAQTITPASYSAGTAYQPGDIVAHANQYWVATATTTGSTPGDVPSGGALVWESYFGPLVVDVWNSPVTPAGQQSSAGTLQPSSYFDGELAFTTPKDGTYTVYRSLVSNNTNDPEGVDAWVDDTVYTTGQVISYNGVNYQSLIDLNFNNTPATSPSQWTSTVTSPLVSNSWRVVTSTLSAVTINYPLGAGPANDSRTRNAFRLPAGFMRQAPTDPKADLNPFLGAPTGLIAPDWLFESNYIVSRSANPITLRFVADVQSVPEFDALFAIGMSSRMAIELAPRLADAEHLAVILATSREEYARTIGEARAINGIETGPVDPYEDDYITARL